MNRYDDVFIFRKAERRDLYGIASFFDSVWKKDGILSNVAFLSYEFAGRNEEINIILAINKKTDEIQGLWGYYPFSMDNNVLDVAGGPWSVKQDDNCMPFLGIEIMDRARTIIGYRTMLGVGDNRSTSGFYHKRFRKDFVGRLSHFYMLNEEGKFKIAIINKTPIVEVEKIELSGAKICEINRISDIEDKFWNEIDKNMIPYKDKYYIEKRFFNHPIYKYDIRGIYLKNVLEAVCFMRRININGSCVNRIVDFIGNKKCIAVFGSYLKTYMKSIGCEYTDFYNYGFDKELLLSAGFIERKEDDVNIIPNYFEPFVQENIEIYFSSPVMEVTLCKADGDQDRPNYIRRS